MKKFIFTTILLGGLSILVLAASVSAATTVSLSPTSVSKTEGQNFSVSIRVNPQGVKNYTAKIEMEYPADLLRVNSFTFGGNWMGINQPGYDLIDNTNGVLVKTAGYPSGISSQVIFGTVLFSAKKAGNGVIKIGNESLVLNATNQNLLSGAVVQTSFVINAPAVTPPAEEEEEEIIPGEYEEEFVEEEIIPGEYEEEFIEEEPIQEKEVVEEQPTIGETTFLAGIGNILSFGSGKAWLAILIGIIILVISIWAINYSIKRSRRKKIK